MKRLILLFALVLSLQGCAPPPPNLTPQAASAFTKTRVIKGLDLLRDTAIDASTPPSTVLTTDDTKRVVQVHESLLKIIDSTGAGWQATTRTSLDELLADLPADKAAILRPYVNLVKSILEAQ